MLGLAWGALTGALIGVGTLVNHSGSIRSFDQHVTSIVLTHRSAALDTAMKAVTWLGSWVALVFTAAAVVVLVMRRRLPVVFVAVSVVVWGGIQGATALAKHVVERPRPPQELRLVSTHGWSWPSGHAATATVVFGVLTAVVWMVTRNPHARRLTALLSPVAVVSVGLSRVELGVHWCTDVVAGVGFACSWFLVVGWCSAFASGADH